MPEPMPAELAPKVCFNNHFGFWPKPEESSNSEVAKIVAFLQEKAARPTAALVALRDATMRQVTDLTFEGKAIDFGTMEKKMEEARRALQEWNHYYSCAIECGYDIPRGFEKYIHVVRGGIRKGWA